VKRLGYEPKVYLKLKLIETFSQLLILLDSESSDFFFLCRCFINNLCEGKMVLYGKCRSPSKIECGIAGGGLALSEAVFSSLSQF